MDEQQLRDVAGQWYDTMTIEARREAFIDMVIINELEVVGHIKECVKKSLGLQQKAVSKIEKV